MEDSHAMFRINLHDRSFDKTNTELMHPHEWLDIFIFRLRGLGYNENK
jgi:hypothetical protein